MKCTFTKLLTPIFISSTELLSPNSEVAIKHSVNFKYFCEFNSLLELNIFWHFNSLSKKRINSLFPQGQNFNNAIISESLDSYKIPFFIDQNRLKTYILNIEIDADEHESEVLRCHFLKNS